MHFPSKMTLAPDTHYFVLLYYYYFVLHFLKFWENVVLIVILNIESKLDWIGYNIF